MNISNLEKDFIQLSVDIGNSMGFDSLSSNILAILYLETEPISMEKISEKTGYSKTSIYNKLKILENLHCIKRQKKAGSKKALFYLEKNIPEMFQEKIKEVYNKKILPLKNRIPKIIEKHEGTKLSKKDKKRLNILKSYNKQVREMEKNMKEMMETFKNG